MNTILIGISMLMKRIEVRINAFALLIFSATEIPFEDIYDDYDDDSVNVTVTDHSSKDNVNANESFSSKLKDM